MVIIKNYFFSICLFLFLYGFLSQAYAESIEIAGGGLSDVYRKEISAGKKGTVKIFLKSAGDPMDGYTVQFFETSGRVPVLLSETKTDGSGIITINGVRPSKYLVILKRETKARLSVSLGDIRIFKEGL